MWGGDTDFEPAWPLYAAVADSIRRISHTDTQLAALCPAHRLANVRKSVLPTGADTFVQHIRAMSTESSLLQSALTHRISTLSHIARVTAVAGRGTRGHAELARLAALTEKESSLWLRVLPTEKFLRLTDVKWQWAARLRLGMEMPHCEGVSDLCEHTKAASECDTWHPLCCGTQSSVNINRRHHAVVQRIAHFSRLLHIIPHIEPGELDPNKARRPDIQLDLPDVTLLGNVTISHPDAKQWRHKVASRGVAEGVGDSREAQKDGWYTPMAQALEMEFCAIVLYTYGGFHASALSFIRQLGLALDPATCLISHTKWRTALMEHIAVAVQRGNADIMIQHSARLRGMAWPTRRAARHPHRRSPPASCDGGRGGRRTAVGSAVGGVVGECAAALAARFVAPDSPLPVTVPASCEDPPATEANGGSHAAAPQSPFDRIDVDADSDAETVVQCASQTELMQLDTAVEEQWLCSSVDFVPESPLVGEYAAGAVMGTDRPSLVVAEARGASAEEEEPRHGRGVSVQGVHNVNEVVCAGASAGSGAVSAVSAMSAGVRGDVQCVSVDEVHAYGVCSSPADGVGTSAVRCDGRRGSGESGQV